MFIEEERNTEEKEGLYWNVLCFYAHLEGAVPREKDPEGEGFDNSWVSSIASKSYQGQAVIYD